MDKQVITNADRIKAMPTDELAAFLVRITAKGGALLERADCYICRKCKKEHDGKCPVNIDTSPCLYDMDTLSTIKYWLEGAVTDERERNR